MFHSFLGKSSILTETILPHNFLLPDFGHHQSYLYLPPLWCDYVSTGTSGKELGHPVAAGMKEITPGDLAQVFLINLILLDLQKGVIKSNPLLKQDPNSMHVGATPQ